jgi:hypothetical protein
MSFKSYFKTEKKKNKNQKKQKPNPSLATQPSSHPSHQGAQPRHLGLVAGVDLPAV